MLKHSTKKTDINLLTAYPKRVEWGEGRRHPGVRLRQSWAAPWAGSGAGHCWTELGSETGWGREPHWSAGWLQWPVNRERMLPLHQRPTYQTAVKCSIITKMQHKMGIKVEKRRVKPNELHKAYQLYTCIMAPYWWGLIQLFCQYSMG